MPTQPTQPGKSGRIEWGRPGPRPAGSDGWQFGPNGGMTRTGTPDGTRPRIAQPSRPTTEGLPQIQSTLPYQGDRFAKLPALGKAANPVVISPDKPLPWTEVDSTNFVVVLSRQVGENTQVGVLEMSKQSAGDGADSLKAVLALSQKLGVTIANGEITLPETPLTATIIGGRNAEPAILRNTLTHYLGVTGEIHRYAAPEQGSIAVAITTTGEPMILSGVPEDQLKPKEQPKGVPPLRRTVQS